MSLMAPRCEHLLRQLSVVATLLPHERLTITGDSVIKKQTPDIATTIMRTLNGDSRETTLTGVRRLVEELEGIFRTELTRLEAGGEPLRRALVEWCRTLTAAGLGLGNLKVTYASDASAAAGVTQILTSLQELVRDVEEACGARPRALDQ